MGEGRTPGEHFEASFSDRFSKGKIALAALASFNERIASFILVYRHPF
jgi:hypothetical protein